MSKKDESSGKRGEHLVTGSEDESQGGEGGGLQGEGEGIRCCRRLTHSPRIKFATDIYSVAGKNTRI